MSKNRSQEKSRENIRKLAASRFLKSDPDHSFDPDLEILNALGRVGFGKPKSTVELAKQAEMLTLPPIPRTAELGGVLEADPSIKLSDSLLKNGIAPNPEINQNVDLKKCNSKYLNDDYLQA